jgi:hypothetical protein
MSDKFNPDTEELGIEELDELDDYDEISAIRDELYRDDYEFDGQSWRLIQSDYFSINVLDGNE